MPNDIVSQLVSQAMGGGETSDNNQESVASIADLYAKKHGVDPKLVQRLIHQESGGNKKATSPKGAMGVMQLMPETAKGLGVTDPYDLHQNIDAGIRYLKQQLDTFGDVNLALAAYNAGPGAVKKYGGIPPYAETQNYVRRIGGGYTGTGRASTNNIADIVSAAMDSGGEGQTSFIHSKGYPTAPPRTQQPESTIDSSGFSRPSWAIPARQPQTDNLSPAERAMPRTAAVSSSFVKGLAAVPAGVLELPALIDSYVENKPLDETASHNWAKWIRETTAGYAPKAQAGYGDSFLYNDLPGGVGNLAGMMAGGLATGGARVATAALGMGLGASANIEDAESHGATADQTKLAGVIGLPLGVVESLLPQALVKGVMGGAGGQSLVRSLVGKAMLGAGSMAAMTAGQNLTAEGLGYDANRNWYEGVGKSAALGGVLGVGGDLVAHSIHKQVLDMTSHLAGEDARGNKFVISPEGEIKTPTGADKVVLPQEAVDYLTKTPKAEKPVVNGQEAKHKTDVKLGDYLETPDGRRVYLESDDPWLPQESQKKETSTPQQRQEKVIQSQAQAATERIIHSNVPKSAVPEDLQGSWLGGPDASIEVEIHPSDQTPEQRWQNHAWDYAQAASWHIYTGDENWFENFQSSMPEEFRLGEDKREEIERRAKRLLKGGMDQSKVRLALSRGRSKLIRMFHGTGVAYHQPSEFKKSADANLWGDGGPGTVDYYTTDSSKMAGTYATNALYGDNQETNGPNIRPMYLDIRDPLDLQDKKSTPREFLNRIDGLLNKIGGEVREKGKDWWPAGGESDFLPDRYIDWGNKDELTKLASRLQLAHEDGSPDLERASETVLNLKDIAKEAVEGRDIEIDPFTKARETTEPTSLEELLLHRPDRLDKAVSALAHHLGYDGIKHTGGMNLGGQLHDVWVAFNQEQIVPAPYVDQGDLSLKEIFDHNISSNDPPAVKEMASVITKMFDAVVRGEAAMGSVHPAEYISPEQVAFTEGMLPVLDQHIEAYSESKGLPLNLFKFDDANPLGRQVDVYLANAKKVQDILAKYGIGQSPEGFINQSRGITWKKGTPEEKAIREIFNYESKFKPARVGEAEDRIKRGISADESPDLPTTGVEEVGWQLYNPLISYPAWREALIKEFDGTPNLGRKLSELWQQLRESSQPIPTEEDSNNILDLPDERPSLQRFLDRYPEFSNAMGMHEDPAARGHLVLGKIESAEGDGTGWDRWQEKDNKIREEIANSPQIQKLSGHLGHLTEVIANFVGDTFEAEGAKGLADKYRQAKFGGFFLDPRYYGLNYPQDLDQSSHGIGNILLNTFLMAKTYYKSAYEAGIPPAFHQGVMAAKIVNTILHEIVHQEVKGSSLPKNELPRNQSHLHGPEFEDAFTRVAEMTMQFLEAHEGEMQQILTPDVLKEIGKYARKSYNEEFNPQRGGFRDRYAPLIEGQRRAEARATGDFEGIPEETDGQGGSQTFSERAGTPRGWAGVEGAGNSEPPPGNASEKLGRRFLVKAEWTDDTYDDGEPIKDSRGFAQKRLEFKVVDSETGAERGSFKGFAEAQKGADSLEKSAGIKGEEVGKAAPKDIASLDREKSDYDLLVDIFKAKQSRQMARMIELVKEARAKGVDGKKIADATSGKSPYYTEPQTAKGKPVEERPQIFVFGSNEAGRHGKGAALLARQKYGAIYGKGEGIQGKSYALPTKDGTIRTMPLGRIQRYAQKFVDFAKAHPEMDFKLTAVGTGLAGYKAEDIAPMFAEAPDNVKIPPQWRELLPNHQSWEGEGTEKYATPSATEDTSSQTPFPTGDEPQIDKGEWPSNNEGMNNPKEYTNHSGGAEGGDTAWDQIGREYGVENHNHYREPGRTIVDSRMLRAKGINAVPLSKEVYQEGIKKANEAARALGRSIPPRYGFYIYRNWAQVKYSDGVFAIGNIVDKGETNTKGYKVRTDQVDGGTGYAVQMAINEGKPVYVFDQRTNSWNTWDGSQFVKTDTPTLTTNFAGVGTRQLMPSGREAIRAVYEKTFEGQKGQAELFDASANIDEAPPPLTKGKAPSPIKEVMDERPKREDLTQPQIKLDIHKEFYRLAGDLLKAKDIKRDKGVTMQQQTHDVLMNASAEDLIDINRYLENKNIDLTSFMIGLSMPSGSDAGRVLNTLSQVAKQIGDVARKNPSFEKELLRIQKAQLTRLKDMESGLYARWTGIFKGAMVAAWSTATRNAASQGARLGIDALVDGLDGALQVNRGLADRPGGVHPLDGLEVLLQLGKEAKITGQQGYSYVKGKLTGKPQAAPVSVADQLLSVLPGLSDKLYQTFLSDIDNIDQKLRPRETRAQKITGKIEDSVQLLNSLNVAQEFTVRRSVFVAKMFQEARNRGIDLHDIIERNDRDKMKEFPKEMWEASIHKALDASFAAEPENEIAIRALQTARAIQKSPYGIGALLDFPFPRFFIQALKFHYQYSPISIPELLFSEKAKAQIAAGDHKRIARAAIGTAMLGIGYAIAASRKDDERWYEFYGFDTRPFNPFAGYLFLGDAIYRKTHGKEFDYTPSEFANAMLAFGSRSDTSLTILGRMVSSITEEDAKSPTQHAAEYAGDVVSRFFQPATTVKDIYASTFDKWAQYITGHGGNEDIIRDVATENPLIAPTMNKFPGLSQLLPEAETPYKSAPPRQVQPWAKQILGLRFMEDKTPLESETQKANMKFREIFTSTGDVDFDRDMTHTMGELNSDPQIAEYLKSPAFQNLKSEEKAYVLSELESHVREAARASAIGKNPDKYMKFRFDSMPKRQRKLILSEMPERPPGL